MSFTTSGGATGTPVIDEVTEPPTATVNGTEVTLRGILLPSSKTAVKVGFGVQPVDGNYQSYTADTIASGPFSMVLSGLLPNHTYYWRATAWWDNDTLYYYTATLRFTTGA
jgi:hypothetical protein